MSAVAHIICTKGKGKKDGNISAMISDRIQANGSEVIPVRDWMTAINYGSIKKTQAIWVQWESMDKSFELFARELRKTNSKIPVIIFHRMKTLPIALYGPHSFLFGIYHENTIMDQLEEIFDRLSMYSVFHHEASALVQKEIRPNGFGPFIGNAIPMLNAYKLVSKVAKTDLNVLITGDSGTGKELIAKTIHNLSHRNSGRFISINCAAIPETLLESELFGFEKGAFTDAVKEKPGKFELANRGTIFLDEIGDMPLMLQTKLLRVLEDKTFERLGGTKEHKVDIRLLAATNQNLPELIEKNRFRPELYYRLNVIPLELYPLADRGVDFELLTLYLLGQFGPDIIDGSAGISWEMVQSLKKRTMRGNVRELENVLARILMNVPNATDINRNEPLRGDESTNGSFEILPLWAVEKKVILKTLKEYEGNVTQTAEKLEISRASLYRKIKQYEVDSLSNA